MRSVDVRRARQRAVGDLSRGPLQGLPLVPLSGPAAGAGYAQGDASAGSRLDHGCPCRPGARPAVLLLKEAVMSSAETDRRDSRERARFTDQALAAARQGRDRIRDRARRRARAQPRRSVGRHPQHLPGSTAVTAPREATDQAAEEAVRLVAVSFAAELAGRPLTRRQRDLQTRAELGTSWPSSDRSARTGPCRCRCRGTPRHIRG
jgi:hypothetical protein